MQIEISSVSPVYVVGKYAKIDLKFFRDGKSGDRTLAGVGDTKKVIEVLKGAKEGDVYDIELVKSEDGKYWNWIGATKVEASAAPAKAAHQVKSTYETPDERSKKQVLIVRQSSLSNAIEYLTAQAKKYSLKDVKDTADFFVSYVFQTQGMVTIDEEKLSDPDQPMTDDIPF